MITTSELAGELDVDEAALRPFLEQLAGDDDLVVDGAFTDAGADLVRAAFTANVPAALLDVQAAATELDRAQAAADRAREARDDAIRAAAARGEKRARIARAAGVSREYVYRVLDAT